MGEAAEAGLDRRTAHLPAEVDWHRWRQFFTDVELWRPVVLSIVEQVCRETGLAVVDQVQLGYAGTCAVFVVGRRLVVKLFPPMLRRDFDRERELYRLLRHRLRCLPRLLASGIYRDRLDWPYLVLQFCHGEPIREVYGKLADQDKRALAQELGPIIHAVHETPLAEARHFNTEPEAWHHFLAQRRQACISELQQQTSLPEAVLAELDAFLDGMEPLLVPSDFRPCLLHADLTDDHLLLMKEGERWRVSALIDWADAEVGASAYEWVALWFGLCQRDKVLFRETLRAYNPALPLDDAFRRRMMAYTVLHRFGAGIVAHVLQQEGQPAVHTLAQLLECLWPAM